MTGAITQLLPNCYMWDSFFLRQKTICQILSYGKEKQTFTSILKEISFLILNICFATVEPSRFKQTAFTVQGSEKTRG